MRKNVLIASFLLVLALGMLAAPIAAQPKDIVQTAIDDGSFTNLLTALELTGLNETLKGPGPFTVFAPTDDAFVALDTGVLSWLIANPTALTEVLLYHVVSGAFNSTDVVALSSIQTLQGDNVSITVDTTVMIDGANITAVDIECTNGVIHVIDAVMIPSGALDIIRTAINAGSFTTLLTALDVAGLTSALEASGPFTVFAPTDDAFAALNASNPGIIDYLLDHPTELAEILLYHVVSGNLTASDVLELGCLTTLQGGLLTIDTTRPSPLGVKIDGANITVVDIICSNGIIHVIDAVLIPEPEPMCIHPVTAIGWGYVRFRRSTCACARWGWWWRSRWRWAVGLAKLEIYPFNTEKHPGGNPHDEPVCVWVVKLTIRKLEAYWTVQSVETKSSYGDDDDDDDYFVPKIIVYATGHAWTWNGEKLPGAPADIKIVTCHAGAFWVMAYGRGIRFFGKGM